MIFVVLVNRRHGGLQMAAVKNQNKEESDYTYFYFYFFFVFVI